MAMSWSIGKMQEKKLVMAMKLSKTTESFSSRMHFNSRQ
jgi:hypothetical protein